MKTNNIFVLVRGETPELICYTPESAEYELSIRDGSWKIVEIPVWETVIIRN